MDKSTGINSLLKRLKKTKNIEYFVIVLAIAIIIGMLNNWFQPKTKDQEAIMVNSAASEYTPPPDQSIKQDQEYRLKQILSSMKGAGEVDVMISYKTGKELVPAMNTVESNVETEEKDSNGGIRKVSQTDINSQPVSLNTSEGAQPLITTEVLPEVLGVIVIAEGAEDIHVRMELQRAVQTVLGINANQVEIFVMDNQGRRKGE